MTDEQSVSTRERILMCAVAIIDARGEAAMRLMDVARDAGITLSLITHYFGTRDNLVAEAQAVRFRGVTEDDAAHIAAMVAAATTPEGFRAGLSTLTSDILDRSRAEIRLARVSAVGACHGRPELLEQLGDATAELTDGMEAVIAGAQASGLIRSDIEPRALATFLQAYGFGMVVADLDHRAADRDAIRRIIDLFADAITTA